MFSGPISGYGRYYVCSQTLVYEQSKICVQDDFGVQCTCTHSRALAVRVTNVEKIRT